MAGLGWQELMIVLVIVIIIFGAGKLPEIGGALGKGIKEFKTESTDLTGDKDKDDRLTTGQTATIRTDDGRERESVVVERREMRADEI